MPYVERKLRATLSFLLADPRLLPHGALLDAGANDGTEACWLASIAPSRQIVAVEPLPANVDDIRQLAKRRSLANVEVIHGSLANASGTDTIVEHAKARTHGWVTTRYPHIYI